MTLPAKYSNLHLPIKHMLSSYRAYSDGKFAVAELRRLLAEDAMLLKDWKVHWVASCALLRSAIDLFRVDARICVSEALRQGFKDEWSEIKKDEKQHEIFWKFLREERNNILHEYKWSAYEQFIDTTSGEVTSPPSILSFASEKYASELIIRTGRYQGESAIRVVEDASSWVADRIYSAIDRAGFEPNERRNVTNFAKEPKREGLLGSIATDDD